MIWLTWLYVFATIALSIYGFNLLVLLCLSVRAWRKPLPISMPPREWPTVVVQLPLYNERYMAQRLIDTVAALDYPRSRLTIQVLDDSTDDTVTIARARVAYQRARGVPITYIHRENRAGFKAGALAEGLHQNDAEFVAVFDADFVPPADFLQRTVAAFRDRPRLAVVQGRWEHLNADDSSLTRAAAMAIDSAFVGDQLARSRSGLMFGFNGSAGVWRRTAIEAAGGWLGDTLTEDLDLSYRAQMLGWEFMYLPQVTAPAVVPDSIIALKNQQARWAKGSMQVLCKLTPLLLRTPMSVWRRAGAFLHLTVYFGHPLLILSVLCALPVVMLNGYTPIPGPMLGLFGLASLGPLLMSVFSQVALYRDWPRRILYVPVLLLIGVGLAVSNTRAIWDAFFGKTNEFVRTPKPLARRQTDDAYALHVDGRTVAEALLALYALATALLALDRAPSLAPFLFLYVLGFGYTAALSLWHGANVRRAPQADDQVRG